MKKHVVVVGGGVAGLTAAHELIERGFEVTLYEARRVLGGKARSVGVPGTATQGRRDLPGEHGFRFVPGFYRHLPDTMKRIPYGDNPNGVFDNLVATTREDMGRPGAAPIIMLPRFPRSFSDLMVLLKTPREMAALGISDEDWRFFAERFWQVLTTCNERRQSDYERIPWWTYIQAERRSTAYQNFLGIGLTRTLVACKAELASTKTIGDIGMQLILNMATPGEESDRVLNGPTNDVWIDPWVEFLKQRGVTIKTQYRLKQIQCADRQIAGLVMTGTSGDEEIQADHYLLALPVEVIARYLDDEILKLDPTLSGIVKLAPHVAWMNGIQYYLKKDIPICRGHQMFLDTPWALTSISQAQFWPDFPMSGFGDGTVGGVLSVDISEWQKPGMFIDKPAMDCTPDEIADEVWAQLKACLNVEGKTYLEDDNLHSWFLDPDILNVDNNPSQHTNAEPLLVNEVGTWEFRPTAHTQIPNLYLASDYVRTYTDLACMEGANEAARRAVNAIIDATDRTAPYAEVWALHEPNALATWRQYDRDRYRRGLQWDPNPPNRWWLWLKTAVTGFIDLLLGRGI